MIFWFFDWLIDCQKTCFEYDGDEKKKKRKKSFTGEQESQLTPVQPVLHDEQYPSVWLQIPLWQVQADMFMD